jgi:hypothetical protein
LEPASTAVDNALLMHFGLPALSFYLINPTRLFYVFATARPATASMDVVGTTTIPNWRDWEPRFLSAIFPLTTFFTPPSDCSTKWIQNPFYPSEISRWELLFLQDHTVQTNGGDPRIINRHAEPCRHYHC